MVNIQVGINSMNMIMNQLLAPPNKPDYAS